MCPPAWRIPHSDFNNSFSFSQRSFKLRVLLCYQVAPRTRSTLHRHQVDATMKGGQVGTIHASASSVCGTATAQARQPFRAFRTSLIPNPRVSAVYAPRTALRNAGRRISRRFAAASDETDVQFNRRRIGIGKEGDQTLVCGSGLEVFACHPEPGFLDITRPIGGTGRDMKMGRRNNIRSKTR